MVNSWNTKYDYINENDTHIFQVLTFRGPLLGLATLSFIAGVINLLVSIFWAVFIAYKGSTGKWYGIHSMPPSIPTVAVIIVAIGISLGMFCLHLYLYRRDKAENPTIVRPIKPVCAVIVLEIIYIVSGNATTRALGINPFNKWVYSVVQALVWVKWGIDNYLLGELHSDSNSEYNWKSGILVYSSSLFLNFILVVVRCKWKYSP